MHRIRNDPESSRIELSRIEFANQLLLFLTDTFIGYMAGLGVTAGTRFDSF